MDLFDKEMDRLSQSSVPGVENALPPPSVPPGQIPRPFIYKFNTCANLMSANILALISLFHQ